MLQKLDAWHRTKTGYAVFALLELLLSYAAISLAIDTGSLLWYLLGILLLVGAVRNCWQLIAQSRKPHAKTTRKRSKKA